MAKCRIIETTPHDRPGAQMPKVWVKFEWSPQQGHQIQVG